MNPFDSASPFDARYYFADQAFFEKLNPYVSENAQVRYLARVEAALAETLANTGGCPRAVALYVSRIGQRIDTIVQAAKNLRGKFAGAVGAYNALALLSKDPAQIEAALMKKLGLEPPEISTQVTQPEYVVDYVYSLTACW